YLIAALALVVAVAATVAWWGYQNHAAVQRLQAAGAELSLSNTEGALGMFTAKVDSFALGKAKANDALLADISQAGISPERLELAGSEVTDAGVGALGNFPSLAYLDLSGTAVGDEAWDEIQDIDSLKYLSLANTQVTEAALAASNAWQQFETLDLSGLQLSGGFVESVSADCKLNSLVLNNTGIQLSQVAGLKACKNLSQLSLAGAKLDAAGLQAIAQLGQLKSLDLSDTQLNAAGLRQLLSSMQLTHLKVANTQVGKQLGTTPLSAPALTYFHIGDSGLDDNNIQALAGLTGLEELNLDGNTALSDAAVDVLVNLRNLKTVHITNTRMPASSAHRLYRSLLKAIVYYGNAGSISYLGFRRK
ncbi:MAG: leucine-rich repeat domain-containing protein, partial [Nevskiales bacterium]